MAIDEDTQISALDLISLIPVLLFEDLEGLAALERERPLLSLFSLSLPGLSLRLDAAEVGVIGVGWMREGGVMELDREDVSRILDELVLVGAGGTIGEGNDGRVSAEARVGAPDCAPEGRESSLSFASFVFLSLINVMVLVSASRLLIFSLMMVSLSVTHDAYLTAPCVTISSVFGAILHFSLIVSCSGLLFDIGAGINCG